MFSKQAKPTQGPAAVRSDTPVMNTPETTAPRKSPKMASLIASDITIEGNVVGDGELHVDGVIRGDVRVPRLSVGETGHIEGSIQAEAVEARGRVIGSITAKQVKLLGSCYIDGDITHEQLAMETGAFFQGRSLKFNRVAPPPPQAALSAPAAPAAPPADAKPD